MSEKIKYKSEKREGDLPVTIANNNLAKEVLTDNRKIIIRDAMMAEMVF